MTSHERQLVTYRREKAAQALKTAALLYEAGDLDACLNRIYYAMFYEVTALLMARNLTASKHRGTMALFAQHFVRTGLVDVKWGKFYNKMFGYRTEADYREHIQFEKDVVAAWIGQAREFIQTLEKLLEKKK